MANENNMQLEAERTVEDLQDKAGDVATDVKDKAGDVAADVKGKASDVDKGGKLAAAGEQEWAFPLYLGPEGTEVLTR